MRLTKEQEEQLDGYSKGQLNSEEAKAIDTLLQNDPEFRQLADQYFLVIKAIKEVDERKKLQLILNAAHMEIEEKTSMTVNPSGFTFLKNYRMLFAIAASIAIVCTAGTFLITRSLQNEQSANYYELRRNVEQIKKSQKLIMADIAGKKISKAPGDFAGTGFLISSAGYLTTSYHVVKDADSIYIENEKVGLQKATMVYSDPTNDLAVLRMVHIDKINTTPPYAIAKKEISLAEEVYTLGYPREEIVFGPGSISALSGYKGNPNAYQISVPVNPGNSGGPLFNSNGDLVGIISGTQTATSGVAFATKSTVLFDLLSQKVPDSLRFALTGARSASLRTSSRVSQVKQWKEFVFIVRVYKN